MNWNQGEAEVQSLVMEVMEVIETIIKTCIKLGVKAIKIKHCHEKQLSYILNMHRALHFTKCFLTNFLI